MAGLLDNPQDAALLKMGLGLLSAGGPSRMPVSLGQAIGSAGNSAMDEYRQTEQNNQMKQMRDMQMQQYQAQLQKAAQEQEAKKRQQAALNQLLQNPQIPQHIKEGVAAGVIDLGDLYKPQKLGEGDNLVSPIQSIMGGDPNIAKGTPKAPKPPVIKDFIVGDQVVQKQFNEATGEWDEIGKGPRFSRQVAPIINMPDASSKPPVGYRFTKDGNLEAIPGGPADAKQQAADKKISDGANDVGVALASLRDAYDRLETGGGITSTKNGAASNLLASTSSSAFGQGLGKALGTQNQSARNDIAMARPALLAALMRATGMSAKQMDSNAELKLWLSTATDPTLDVEANRKALDNIERKYIKPQNQATPQKTVVRRGKYGGKTVIQYDDGSIEYAD